MIADMTRSSNDDDIEHSEDGLIYGFDRESGWYL